MSIDIQWAHELAIDASPTGVALCDEEGRILFANPQLATIFGYAPDELVGASVDVLLPKRLQANHPVDRRSFWTQPTSHSIGTGRDLCGRRKDGSEVEVEISLRLATQNGRRLVIASVVDITDRRQLEQQIQQQAADRLGFEQVVAEIAVRFVNPPLERVDEVVVDSQRQMVEVLGVDRSALWQFTENDEDLIYTHYWSRPELPLPPPRPSVSAHDAFPWLLERVRAGQATWIERLDEVPNRADRLSFEAVGIKSSAVVPLKLDGRVVGALTFGAVSVERQWEPAIRERLRLVAAIFAQALAWRRSEEQLRGALTEVERLRDRLTLENFQLRNEVKTLKAPSTIAAESAAAKRLLAQIENVASTPATVLLLGETGSGKEVVAQAIHDFSERRGRPMVRVNCAAIPTQLLESELFGRERGAYTGALSRQIGRFEMADGSTLFLDEIGELPQDAQVKLLRVLQDRVVERLGSGRPIQVDVRIIAASNRDLTRAMAERHFREDLFYRLNVFPITVPPLRERAEDIPVLVWSFVAEFSKAFNKPIESISKEDLAALQRYAWPGNVRELRNVIERAVIVANSPHLSIPSPQPVASATRGNLTLSSVEVDHIRSVLQNTGWRVRGPGGAAEVLGVRPTTLDSRMAKLGIRRPLNLK
jgi:PAS domain S-box-containing protein